MALKQFSMYLSDIFLMLDCFLFDDGTKDSASLISSVRVHQQQQQSGIEELEQTQTRRYLVRPRGQQVLVLAAHLFKV